MVAREVMMVMSRTQAWRRGLLTGMHDLNGPIFNCRRTKRRTRRCKGGLGTAMKGSTQTARKRWTHRQDRGGRWTSSAALSGACSIWTAMAATGKGLEHPHLACPDHISSFKRDLQSLSVFTAIGGSLQGSSVVVAAPGCQH